MISALIKEVMRDFGLKQADLATLLDVSIDRIKNITSGRAKNLSREETEALVKNLQIRGDWLATGEGPMRQSEGEGERGAPRAMAAIKAMAEKMPVGLLKDHERAYLQNILFSTERGDFEQVARLLQELPSSDEAELLALYRAAPLMAKMAAVNALQHGERPPPAGGMAVTFGGENRGAVAEKIINKGPISFGGNS